MEYLIKSGAPQTQRTGCVVVGIFERRKPTAAASALDEASGGAIGAALRSGDMDGKAGQTLMLRGLSGLVTDRVLLVGLGRERDFDDAAFRKACTTAARALTGTGAQDAVSYLTTLDVRGRDLQWNVQQAALAAHAALYRFDQCRGAESAEKRKPPKLRRLGFAVASRSERTAAEQALARARAIGAGMELTRDLANLPGNLCTPSHLADQARELARQYRSLRTRVLERKDMEALGMGALLAVARGSSQPPKLIAMEYRNGPKDQKPIILVGKGLTFDAGGISLKPADKMDEMKYDMCGGATVFGVIKAVAEMELPINVVGVVPSSENLPDGNAVKPGDIVTTMSGITVEILNTDAEGRLILCDALTWAQREWQAEAIIDMATLTGACVIALGRHAHGLFSNHAPLARALLAAGEQSGDRAWELPVWEDYQRQLDSPFADVANVGGREAGAITAACFLHRFVRKARWAHLDIAGTAWTTNPKGATGRPVPLLASFLIERARRAQG